jgi:hypothetical protein
MQPEDTIRSTMDRLRLPPSRRRSWLRLIALFVVGVLATAGVGFWAGSYWASHMSSSAPPRPVPEVLLAKNVVMPPASYTLAQASVGWAYWDAQYAGLGLEFAYSASFAIDACLIDLPVGDPGGGNVYASCASHPGSATVKDRSAGVMGFTVPGQRDNGFDFVVLSPHGVGGNVTFAWWINSTSGTTVTRWPSDKMGLPWAQLLAESRVSESVFLPEGYDRVSVQGWSTYAVYLAIDHGYSVTGGTRWNWTVSYETPRTFEADLYTRSFDPVNVSLTVLVFKS